MASDERQVTETNDQLSTPSPRRKWLRWIIGIILFPIILLNLIGLLLYLPPIQKLAVDYAANKISESTGWDVSIGNINIGFPLKLNVGDLIALDANEDTIAYLGHFKSDIPVAPLLNGDIPISNAAIRDAILNYYSEDSLFSIVGRISQVDVNQLIVGLNDKNINIKEVAINNANVAILAGDTVQKKDTIKQPAQWHIELGNGRFNAITASVKTHPDSALVDLVLNDGRIINGVVDLPSNSYTAKRIKIDGTLYNVGTTIDQLPTPWDVYVDGQDLYYDMKYQIRGHISDLKYHVANGLGISSGKATIDKDTTRMKIQDLNLKMNHSYLKGEANLPMKEFMPSQQGEVHLNIDGHIELNDIKQLFNETDIPDLPIIFTLGAKGQMEERIALNGDIKAPEVFSLTINGTGTQVMDSIARKASVHLTGETAKVMPYIKYIGIQSPPAWQIPEGIIIDGDFEYSGTKMGTKTGIKLPIGTINIEGDYQSQLKSYQADVEINEVDIRQIFPRDTIPYLSATLQASGKGTDLFSPFTTAKIKAMIDSVVYRGNAFSKISLVSELKEQQFFAALNSQNPGLGLTAQVDALLKRHDINGSLNLYVDTIVPSRLGLQSNILLGTSLELRSTLRSDLREYYEFSGEIENCHIETDKAIVSPTNIYIDAKTSQDSLSAHIKSGDMNLVFNAQNGLNDFTGRVNKLSSEIKQSTSDTTRIAALSSWIKYYPKMQAQLTMGRSNFLRTYLDERRIGWKSLSVKLGTDNTKGLTGDMYVSYFQKDTFRIDDMDMTIRQDSVFFYAIASVHKERFRNQEPFNAMVSVTTNVHRSELYVNIKDAEEKDFIQLGMDLTKEKNNDMTIRFTPDPPVLAYNRFKVIGSNYITLPQKDPMHLNAHVHLLSDDNAAITLRDTLTNEGHTIIGVVKDFSLANIKGVSVVPDIQGLLNARAMWVQTTKGDAYTLHLNADNFIYNKSPIGHIEADAIMMPGNQGDEAALDLKLDQKKALTAEAFMPKDKKDPTRWHVVISELPAEKANPFIPKEMAKLSGQLSGEVYNFDIQSDIKKTRAGKINGKLSVNEGKVFVPMVNEYYVIDDKPIIIANDQMRFDNFGISANGRRLISNGYIGLSEKLPVNMRLKGKDLVLLDSSRSTNSILFGKIGADADIQLQGPAKVLSVRGHVDIKGNTNVTYMVKDSELDRSDRFKGLVEFTDFSDTLFVAKKSAVDSLSLGGLDIRLGIHIDPAVRATALLTKDSSNKVSIEGGGDLNILIPPYGTMSLNGAYNINDGEITYSFPGFSNKFKIDRNSGVSWNGNVMNPNIDFKATSRVKSDVALPGEKPRKVNFDVSIIAKNSLDNIALLFTLDAPEDLSIRNNLMAMTDEERSRQALALLATRRYLGSQQSSSSNFDMGTALSSLLASQLNTIAGDALDAEINFGVEQESAELGGGTNYSYSIAKRFYNDRITIVVGGRVQTGAAAIRLEQSLIDNVSLEYRLDQAGTHYLRLFHNKNYENLFDGEVIETGVGYVIRRRLNKLWDIFNFSKKRLPALPPLGEDNPRRPSSKKEKDQSVAPLSDRKEKEPQQNEQIKK